MTEQIVTEQRQVTLSPGRWYALGTTGVQVFIVAGPMINMVYRKVEDVPATVLLEEIANVVPNQKLIKEKSDAQPPKTTK